MERRWLGLMAVVAAFALVLAACGAGDDDLAADAPVVADAATDQDNPSPSPPAVSSDGAATVMPAGEPDAPPSESLEGENARDLATALLLEAEEIGPNYAQNQEDDWDTVLVSKVGFDGYDPTAQSDGPLSEFGFLATGWLGSLERVADNMELASIFMDPATDPSQLNGLDIAVTQSAVVFRDAAGAQSALEFFRTLTLLQLTAEFVPAADPAGFEISEFDLDAGERSRGLLIQGAAGSSPPGLPVGVLAVAAFQRDNIVIVLCVASFTEPRIDMLEAVADVLDAKIGQL